MLLDELSQAHDRLQDASTDGPTLSHAHFLNKQHHHITHNVGRFGVEGTCSGMPMVVAKLLSSELRCCNIYVPDNSSGLRRIKEEVRADLACTVVKKVEKLSHLLLFYICSTDK
jgi:hypothetical protein